MGRVLTRKDAVRVRREVRGIDDQAGIVLGCPVAGGQVVRPSLLPDLETPDVAKDRERGGRVARVVPAVRREDQSEGEVLVRVGRSVAVEEPPSVVLVLRPEPGEQVILTDLEMSPSPPPDTVEGVAVVKPDRSQHRVGLPLGTCLGVAHVFRMEPAAVLDWIEHLSVRLDEVPLVGLPGGHEQHPDAGPRPRPGRGEYVEAHIGRQGGREEPWDTRSRAVHTIDRSPWVWRPDTAVRDQPRSAQGRSRHQTGQAARWAGRGT